MKGSPLRFSLLAAAIFGAIPAFAALEAGRTGFPGSVREIPAVAAHGARILRTALKDEENAASMTFEVALRMRNFDEMQARIARGEIISASEKEERYFPLAADHDRVVAWLGAQGLEVTRTDGDRLGIFARGTVRSVAAAFNVSFARVLAEDGREFTSAVTAPSVPDDVAAPVLGVHGLQPHIRRHPFISAAPEAASPRFNLSGYLPAQIATAYNANGLSVDGTGQTIAIYALAFPAKTDLSAFWASAQVSQKTSNVQMINVGGGPSASPSPSSLDEACLDVEWAGAIAPGASIRVYGADENDPAENDEILQQVYADLPSNPSMHTLSISIGGNEHDVPADYLVIEAQYFANLASAGVSVLVASGDTGATAEGIVQTTYPTSDPDVTGVGGTTLVLFSNNTVSTETGWSKSGGGISYAFSRPSWQTGPGVAAASAGTMRLVPDVASSADPNDGAAIEVGGQQLVIGGTSWSAPTWAGFCALLNQNRATPLGLLNPKIYPLGGTAAIRDITAGSNGNYSAGAGFDLVTGLGVPNVAALLSANLASPAAAVVPAQLGDQTVTLGQPATFFVVGYGAPPLTYQWQRLPNGSTTWASLSDSGVYSGSATPALVVSGGNQAQTGDQFRCTVSNSSGSSVSTPATLTVNRVGVTTFAGWPGSSGNANGAGRAARLADAGGVRTDAQGNVFVADSSNYTIRRITPQGVVSTFAGVPDVSGSADGPASAATFAGVGGVAIDAAGNVYVADSGNYTVRKITSSGTVSTLAGVAGTRGETDGTGSAARFYDPQNLAVDASGNIYVSDGKGDVIRKVTPSGVVTTVAGTPMTPGSADGTGSGAQFNNPTGITVDLLGNIYVADNGNDTVRKIAPGAVVTTIAGKPLVSGSADGTGSAASFDAPAGVGADSSGNVYVADSGNDTIRAISPSGFVTTIAGSAGAADSVDGISTAARFNTPGDVCVDNSGVIYVADAGNSTIRRIIRGTDSVPFFNAQPASQSVTLGSGVILTMGIAGTAPFTYQWSLNGAAIAGATLPYYAVAQAQPSDGGTYTVTITNVDGSVTSAPATLTVNIPAGYPDITSQPVGGPLPASGGLVLSVSVTGTGPFSYQWALNGSAIAGATGSTYTATTSGSYTVAITNAVATSVSSPALVGSTSRLVNVSTRALVQTGGGIEIAGFAVSGPAGHAKQLLIRGAGPALSAFQVSGALATPTITLLDSGGNALASNTGWGTGADPSQVTSLSAQAGAFAFQAGSADSALVANLPPGTYTVQLSGTGSATGVALAEVYETSATDPSQLTNISTRGFVGTGGNIMIAGFVVGGSQAAKVLVRGVGPGLSAFQVSGVLAKPTVTVFDSAGNQLGSNTGWQTAPDPTQASSTAAKVGAFALSPTSADSALVLTLQPGVYSVQVTGSDGGTGVALAEIYQVLQ